MSVELINSDEDFSKLEIRWSEIGKAGGIRTPFQSFAWIDQWLRYRGKDVEPFILVIDDSIVAPFGLSRVAGIRILRLLGTPDSDYLGLVTNLPSGPAWDSVMRAIGGLRGDWDLLHLHSVHEREAIVTALVRHIGGGFRERLYDVCPLIKIDRSWDALLAGRRNLRKNLKRWTRRLEEMGTIRVEVVAPPMTDILLSELVEVERASWKWETGNATFKPGSWCDFIRGILKDPRMQVELWLLRLSEKLVGFQLMFIAENRWYCYMAICRKDCPNAGSYLLAQLIERACTSGCEIVDLLRGSEEYKYAWTDLQGEVYEIVVPSNLGGHLFAMGYHARWHVAQSSFVHRLRNYLTRTGDRR
jgi:CelD/BcsL family acetyltransferase involved in cellulose biosynthesis